MEQKQISVPAKQHQWFIAQNLESDTQIFYTIDDHQYHYQKRVNELHGRRIRAYFHGWVILSNHPDDVLWSLWNPLTSKLIRLPPLVHEQEPAHECCLSAPPDEQGSVFLLTTSEVPTIVFSRLDRKIKRLKWTEMSYVKQLRIISGVDGCLLESPTCCNGKVYAMTLGPDYRFVILVDIMVKGDKEVVITLMPFVKVPYTSYNRCPAYNNFDTIDMFLIGSCKDLFCIGVCFTDETMIGNVYLFKLDFTSMAWEKVVDLKDAMFFIEYASGYSTCYYDSAVNSEVGGYVHILGESGKIIYSFHAEDRTVSLSSMPRLVQESRVHAWAMLEWRLEIDHFESKQEEAEKDAQIIIKPEKGDNTDFDCRTCESHLLDIPIHILEIIMEHCIGIEYMRFRATCKYCRLAAPSIQWNNEATLRRLHTYSLVSPLLMVLDNYRGIITFIDPICGERYFITIPQELKGDYQIYCSRFGWLLMYKIEGGPEIALFNPFTSDIRKLPRVPFLQSFCFSAPPTSSDCMVVGFTRFGPRHIFICFVSREPTWFYFRLNFGGDDPYSYHFPTFNGRDVYALYNNKGVHSFRDMTETDYSWDIVTDETPKSHCKSRAKYFMASCDQHLLLVIIDDLGRSVEVFKLNESTTEWEKTNCLGKHMIYISGTSCICLDAKSPEMGNKIYFPRTLHKDATKIVFYSLETDRYHNFDDKSIQESFSADLLKTKHYCDPHTWIEPSWF
ncbi:hypothetical protein SSX86_015031 [Deinandra increscens subsp. villosa]|uniref:KIB1-4 beta-propeller domain-containing protein n=1 Tax=Deinandra increscens subsp. villosa TaxID=3103831 RepID=A0AAP0D3U8_9ASTR